MDTLRLLVVLATLWVAVAVLVWTFVMPWLRDGPRGDPMLGLLWRLVRRYCEIRHEVRHEGLEHVPRRDGDHDGLIIVANHTGAVDPFLLQAATAAWIRWMMGRDMMSPGLDWAWRLQRIIPVDRANPDAAALKAAIRHVKDGGCVGVFPEGRIEQPPGVLRPFQPGVGAIARATGAPVLLAWIADTPPTNRLGLAFRMRSRSRVVFLGRFTYDRSWTADAIALDLRAKVAEASSWPVDDTPLPVGGVHGEATAPSPRTLPR